MKNVLVLAAATIMLLSLARPGAAAVPDTINYQGRLTDSTGLPLDTTVSMTFTIYDDPLGRTTLWSETQPSVIVGDGLFDALLGAINPIPDTVFSGGTRYLGMQIDSGPETDPLIPIVSVAYAYRAIHADTAAVSLGSGGDCLWTLSGSDIYYNEGDVGIGTASPDHKLDVAGDIRTTTHFRIGDYVVLQADGNSNIGVGASAGANNTGTWSTFVGAYAAPDNQGHNNVFVGRSTGYFHTTGGNNTFVGQVAGYDNISGSNNTFIGQAAGRNATGSSNVFLGYGAGYSETGDSKLIIANNSSSPLIYGDFSSQRVGIGTTDLTHPLNVDGKIYTGGTSGGFTFRDRTASFFPDWTWYAQDGIARLYKSFSGDLMALTATGYLGLGSTSPGFHRLYALSAGHRVPGATAFFHNTSDSGIALLAENDSEDATAVFLQRGSGDVLRCFYIGPGEVWNFTFRVTQQGRAICNVLELLGGSDLAEPFAMSGERKPEPGAVVVIDDKNPGKLTLSQSAYDTKVAGIVSGAGGVQPGLTLTQKEVFEDGQNVAISGRVYCLADASYGIITPGDLLTTSDTPGHAMKATDRVRAYGAVIGKAMTSLQNGRGLVLVLVNLH